MGHRLQSYEKHKNCNVSLFLVLQNLHEVKWRAKLRRFLTLQKNRSLNMPLALHVHLYLVVLCLCQANRSYQVWPVFCCVSNDLVHSGTRCQFLQMEKPHA